MTKFLPLLIVLVVSLFPLMVFSAKPYTPKNYTINNFVPTNTINPDVYTNIVNMYSDICKLETMRNNIEKQIKVRVQWINTNLYKSKTDATIQRKMKEINKLSEQDNKLIYKINSELSLLFRKLKTIIKENDLEMWFWKVYGRNI